MAFTLHLSSAPNAADAAQVSLEGSGLNSTIPFPAGGTVASFEFNVPGSVLDRVWIAFRVGDEVLPLEMEKLPANSSMSLLALPNKAFMGSVYHAETSTDCVVKCADGSEGRTCVVCKRGKITARICC